MDMELSVIKTQLRSGKKKRIKRSISWLLSKTLLEQCAQIKHLFRLEMDYCVCVCVCVCECVCKCVCVHVPATGRADREGSHTHNSPSLDGTGGFKQQF